ncbi:hypothetical protein Plec18170_002332 [Paecilomyces lecythidis]
MDENKSPHRKPTSTPAYNLRSTTPSAPPLNPQQLFLHICHATLDAKDNKELIYRNIAREVGSLVAELLAEEPRIERACARVHFNSAMGVLRISVIRTEIDNVHVQWIKNELMHMVKAQFLLFDECTYLEFNVGTRFTGFPGIYAGSSKEPDLFLRPGTSRRLPRVIIETGSPESWPHLQSDRTLWFSGSEVRYVILLKWTKTSDDHVMGLIEVFHRNPPGEATLLCHEQLFPVPALAIQDVPITLDELFGPHITPGRDPNASFQLSLNRLRVLARDTVLAMGLTPE